jgi:NADPH:quinone reductase-like Zn-dependent oxidoreductase
MSSATMRAYVVRGARQASLEDVPTPEPGPGQVRLRVAAVGLNRLDVFVRKGIEGPGIRPVTLPHVSGVDVVGRVDAAGPRVTGWSEGDRVTLYPGLGCGTCRACHAGEISMCPQYRVFGEQCWGGLAQYTVVPAGSLAPVPDGMDDVALAAAPAAYTTALRMLRAAGNCGPGARVLVIGIGGGVATAALLLARVSGATVYVTSGHRWKLDRALELGAEAGFVHGGGGIEDWAQEVTGGKGMDLVIESVGAATWRQSIRSLAAGGCIAVCGATSGDRPNISIRELYQRHGRIVGAPIGGRPDFDDVMELVFSRTITPIVDTIYAFEAIEEAFARLESGDQFGKVVVDVAAE